jgi:tRNA (guanine37-N1)-methyltransferase
MRVAKQVKDREVVVNMFAGIGCFSLIIAKHSSVSKVYSIDINPTAFKFMKENIRINRVYGKVAPILGDARGVNETRFRHSADRVLMPLPEKALEYLPSAVSALKETGGWIHYYDFEHAGKGECLVEKSKLKAAQKLRDIGKSFVFSYGCVVRPTGPNWYQIALDILVSR